jgi:hypothetical protein
MFKKIILVIVSIAIAINVSACGKGSGGDLTKTIWDTVHEQCSADPECAQHQLNP